MAFLFFPRLRLRSLLSCVLTVAILFMLINLYKRVSTSIIPMAKRFKGTLPRDHRLILDRLRVIVTEGDLSVVAEGPDLIIHQPDSVLNNMSQWCADTFSKNGLLDRIKSSTVSLQDAESQVLQFLNSHTETFTCPLAGNSVSVDRTFIDRHMPALAKHLHYRTVDVTTIKELCMRWYPSEFCTAPRKAMTHRALDDIRESIEELKYYRQKIFIK